MYYLYIKYYITMANVRITESKLRALIKESVEETMIEEGFLDNLGAAWDGAKRSFKAQKSLDKSIKGLKRHHDYEDLQKHANPFGPGMENTAEEEANEVYQQYKEHMAIANRLLSKYKQLVKEYGLVYTGDERDPNSKRLGKRVNPGVKDPTPNPNFKGAGVPIPRKSAYDVGGRKNPDITLR